MADNDPRPSTDRRRRFLWLRVAGLVLVGVVLVNAQRVLSAWTDRMTAFVSLLVLIVVLLLLLDRALELAGPPVWRVTRSVGRSIGLAVVGDREVRRFLEEHPRTARFLGARLTLSRWSGWYLTATLALAGSFLIEFFVLAVGLFRTSRLVASDPYVLALLAAFRAPSLTRVLWAMTLLGGPTVILASSAFVVLLLLLSGKRASAVLLSASMSLGMTLNFLIKDGIRRPRPPMDTALIHEPSSFSFPSGHSFASFLFLGLLAFLLVRAARTLRARLLIVGGAAFLTFLIGLSRIYLGVHWMTDVLASWSLAAAWLCLSLGAFFIWQRYDHAPADVRPVSRRRLLVALSVVTVIVALGALVVTAERDPLLAKAVEPERPKTLPLRPGPNGLPTLIDADAARLPRFSQKLDGSAQEPIGLVFLGTREQLVEAFDLAGWQIADPPTLGNVLHAIVSAAANKAYPTAPVTPSFLDGEVEDIAFERPEGTATIRRRHHTRWWQTDFSVDGRPVWVATASFDEGLERSRLFVVTHKINANIDAERDTIVADLKGTGLVVETARVRVSAPLAGTNAQGDTFFTQGKAIVLGWKGR